MCCGFGDYRAVFSVNLDSNDGVYNSSQLFIVPFHVSCCKGHTHLDPGPLPGFRLNLELPTQ